MKYKFLFLIVFVLSVKYLYAAEVTTFSSPDCSFMALKNFLSNTSSLYIATYEFTNPCILNLLNRENISEIKILVDGSPVGGMPLEEKKILCIIEKNGGEVYLYKKEGRNYHHAKYLIKNNTTILITSENLGYAGFSKNPNFGNRGWGAIIEDENLTKNFLDVFFSDIDKAEKFKCDIENYSVYCDSKCGNYKPIFELKKFFNQSVYAIFAPNAVESVLKLLDSANKSIYIEEFYIYKFWGSGNGGAHRPNLFLEKVINKSREGVDVKILLDSYWYNMQPSNPISNYYTLKYINNIAREENLSLRAKLVDLKKGGIKKVHNKGLIIDNKSVLISSINWNEHSPKYNRESGVVITGEAAKYYANIFMLDWNDFEKGKGDDKNILFPILVFALLLSCFIIVKKICKKNKNYLICLFFEKVS